eukprot:159177_1
MSNLLIHFFLLIFLCLSSMSMNKDGTVELHQGSAEAEPLIPQEVPRSNDSNSLWMEHQAMLNSIEPAGLKIPIMECLRGHIANIELIKLWSQHRSVTSFWAKLRIDPYGFCHIKYFIGIPNPTTAEYPHPRLVHRCWHYPTNASTLPQFD